MKPPLLAPKEFHEFTAHEFRAFVVGLYAKRVRKAAARKPKKPKPEFSISLNKKGSLVVRVSRTPKWILRAELEAEATRLGIPLADLLKAVEKRKIQIGEQPSLGPAL